MGNLPSPVKLKTTYQQFTQELRLASPDDGAASKVHWVAGLYFAQQTVHNTDFQQIPGINSTFLSLYGETLEQSSAETAYNGGAPNTVLFPNDIDESDNRTYRETQYAAFGQIDYDPCPTGTSAPARRYEIAAEHFNSTEIGFYQIGNISPYHQEAKSNSFTPKLTLSHDFTANETVYASAGEGFRLGGPDRPDHLRPRHCLRRRLRRHQPDHPAHPLRLGQSVDLRGRIEGPLFRPPAVAERRRLLHRLAQHPAADLSADLRLLLHRERRRRAHLRRRTGGRRSRSRAT